MAEPTFEAIESWLLDNSDKEGTPDYVKMSNAYRALDPQGPAPAVGAKNISFGEDMMTRLKFGLGIDTPDTSAGRDAAALNLDDIMAAKRLTSDPRSLSNRADRVMAGAIGGVPDLGIGVYNAGARMVGSPDSQVEYLTPKMLNNAGVPALPEDAPWYERLGEAGASAFVGGGAGAAGGVLSTARNTANVARAALPAGSSAKAIASTAMPVGSTAVRMALPTVVPTVAGAAGGEAGAYLGKKFLGDEETGALLGSLLGGSAMAAKPAVQSIIHQIYDGKGAPNARDIFAAANRQGVTPTAGMLGDESIMRREQRYAGMPGSAGVVQDARNTSRAQIGDAYNQSAEARGAIDMNPTPGTIGENVNIAARESADALRAGSDARQVALQDRVGANTPVNVSPIFERGYGMMADPAANLTPSARRAIDYRLTNELMPLIDRNAGGDPLPPPGVGHNGGPPLAGETAPYGNVRGFRTELGQGIDTPAGGRLPPTSQLYGPTTDAMRDTAASRGVSPQNFDTTQAHTRAVERTTPTEPGGPIGDYPALQRYINEDPAKSFSYLNSGRQNPDVLGILEATQHPLINQIYGDVMRLIGNDTINKPGARGPANFDNAWSRMHPDARSTILGDQLPNVADQVSLARALDIPTSQAGLTRAVGGQGDAVANKVMGSEILGQAGNEVAGSLGAILGRILGVIGPAGIRSVRAGVLEGPTARNAMTGGPDPRGLAQLQAALTAAASQQQQRTPGVP